MKHLNRVARQFFFFALLLVLPLSASAALNGSVQDAVALSLSAPVSAPVSATPSPSVATPAPATATQPPATNASDALPSPTPFTLLRLSDTQRMAYSYPSALRKMGGWISENLVRRNIILAVQTGDAVEHGANNTQWAAVDACLSAFQQKIPYFAIAGNHELGVREKNYAWFLERPYIRALPQEQVFEGGKAAYMTFHAGGRDFLLLGAGWDAELAATDWMNEVLFAHPDHVAILLFHGFMDRAGRLTTVGRKLYPAVVANHPNVRMVLCGHIPGHFSRTDLLDDDGDGTPERKVHIMLYNFQHYTDRCGQLRLLTFDPLAGSVSVETYSPVTDVQYRAFPYQEPIYTVDGLF